VIRGGWWAVRPAMETTRVGTVLKAARWTGGRRQVGREGKR
jgi:hypothetical protein